MNKSIFVIRYRWQIIITIALLVGLSIIPLLNIKVNPDMEKYLPDSIKSKQNNIKINEVFGNEDIMLVVLEAEDVLNEKTLERIQNISDVFSQMPQFTKVYSLFQAKDIRGENGSMVVNSVVSDIPKSDREREELRNDIKNNEMAYKVVVSDDFRYALIMMSFDKSFSEDSLMMTIDATLEQFFGTEQVYISGQPYLRYEAKNKIARDIMILLPIGLLLMLLFLWFSFRQIRAMLLPFFIVIFSIVICMAMLPVLGWELSIIGVLIPIMMISIANNYGVYFVARYQDLNAENPNYTVNEIVQKSVSYLTTPIILCGLTTIAGILGLVAHLLTPARQMGVVAAIAIAFALLASLLFIPAVMASLKKGKVRKRLSDKSKGVLPEMLEKIGRWITIHPKHIMVIFAVFFALSVVGICFMRVAPDNNRILPDNHPFNMSVKITDKHFGGNKMINIMFDGDATDPALLKRMDFYEQELKKMPNIGTVTSLASTVKKISTALNDSTDAEYNQIPDTRQAVAQYLELYSLSGDPADFEKFVNFDYTKTLMTIQYRANSAKEINEVMYKITELTKADSANIVVGGYSLIEKELSDSIVSGQCYSLIVAFIIILILLGFIFKSIKAGIIGCLPILFAVSCVFGLMGWFNIELNIATALLSSISIGLGVDFTIHIFWRIKWELTQGNDYETAIVDSLRTIGRGIVINAFSVMLGFAVLFLSAFSLLQSFAFLIIISLFMCLVSALIFITALCYLINPKFLEKKM
ncbi:MAG: MMPL family transporter [Bacteroidales bacterium]|jgi:predicted RND superfamily exporter protein|nr:MMPL family transporter [Bacteroidales bacterium]